MKILITGGAGYIGSHTIVELLESTDWSLVSIDNYSNSSPDTYRRIEEITGRKVEHEDVDLRDEQAVDACFDRHRFDGVIHFAALKAVGESVEKPLEYYENNVGGLIHLIKAQRKYGVKYHLFSSSCTVYGTPPSLPVTEDSPIGKSESPYGFSKVIGERILSDCALQWDMDVLALRYFNPVGAHTSGKLGELPLGVPNNLLPYITQTAAGHRDKLTIFGDEYPTRDGTCIRDYIHVTDIAKAHIMGMRRLIDGLQEHSFDFINLGTGNGVSVQEIVDAFKETNQVDLPYIIGPARPGDIAAIYADNGKAREKLMWTPQLGLDDMVSSAWKWQCHLDQSL
ncbi:MAG: UDP-glucose 4-epimerase GalE [Flavobacteriales bacterium]|nr:UDP-glucose 4-epimerase GalE [Flavobacteriales bacterium]